MKPLNKNTVFSAAFCIALFVASFLFIVFLAPSASAQSSFFGYELSEEEKEFFNKHPEKRKVFEEKLELINKKQETGNAFLQGKKTPAEKKSDPLNAKGFQDVFYQSKQKKDEKLLFNKTAQGDEFKEEKNTASIVPVLSDKYSNNTIKSFKDRTKEKEKIQQWQKKYGTENTEEFYDFLKEKDDKKYNFRRNLSDEEKIFIREVKEKEEAKRDANLIAPLIDDSVTKKDEGVYEIEENFVFEEEKCSVEYAPVCGEKFGVVRTFINKCRLDEKNALYLYEGVCTEQEAFSRANTAEEEEVIPDDLKEIREKVEKEIFLRKASKKALLENNFSQYKQATGKKITIKEFRNILRIKKYLEKGQAEKAKKLATRFEINIDEVSYILNQELEQGKKYKVDINPDLKSVSYESVRRNNTKKRDIQNSLKANDYDLFIELSQGSPMEKYADKKNFDLLRQIHSELESGNNQKAKELSNQLKPINSYEGADQ